LVESNTSVELIRASENVGDTRPRLPTEGRPPGGNDGSDLEEILMFTRASSTVLQSSLTWLGAAIFDSIRSCSSTNPSRCRIIAGVALLSNTGDSDSRVNIVRPISAPADTAAAALKRGSSKKKLEPCPSPAEVNPILPCKID